MNLTPSGERIFQLELNIQNCHPPQSSLEGGSNKSNTVKMDILNLMGLKNLLLKVDFPSAPPLRLGGGGSGRGTKGEESMSLLL